MQGMPTHPPLWEVDLTLSDEAGFCKPLTACPSVCLALPMTSRQRRKAISRTCPKCNRVNALRLIRLGLGHWKVQCGTGGCWEREYLFERVRGSESPVEPQANSATISAVSVSL